jgi:RNA polymerase-interacting CarD/CdnL/TRCF family regulator
MRGDSYVQQKKLFFGLVMVIVLTAIGCTKVENEGTYQSIHIVKYDVAEDKDKGLRTVSEEEEAKKAKKVLGEAKWQKAKMEMSRKPDYQFYFESNATDQAIYRVWVTPDNSQLQVIRGTDEYAKLTQEQSDILHEVLTGSKLSEEQVIHVTKRVDNKNHYEEFRKVIDSKQVNQVKEILEKIKWENKAVKMIRPSDYAFSFQYKNPQIEAKTLGYDVWINSDIKELEITRGDGQYAKLAAEQSAVLVEILLGK